MATYFTMQPAIISHPKSSLTFSRNILSSPTARLRRDGPYWTEGSPTPSFSHASLTAPEQDLGALPSEQMIMRKLRFLPVLVLAALLSGFGGETRPLGVAQAEAAPRVSEAGAAAALISRYRAAYGLGPVKVDARLNAAAEHQARAVAQAGSLSHGDFAARIAAFGIRGQAAENLSAGVRSVEEAIAQWQGSSGHNANLLLPQVTRIGLARAEGGGYGRYWALVLAR